MSWCVIIILIMQSVARAISVIAVGALALSACSSNAPREHEIVAGSWPVVDLVRSLVGQSMSVQSLTPPGVEPHDLELDADALASIERAEAVVFVGGGFQPALERAVRALSIDATEISVAADDGGFIDPHVWMAPGDWAAVARNLGPDLAAAFPADASQILARVDSVVAALTSMEERWMSAFESCERTTLVVAHGAFARWARYGLKIEALVGAVPGVEPTAARLADVEAIVRRTGTTTVFTELGASPRAAESIAAATGVRVERLDPLELDAPGDYAERMAANLEAIRGALVCQ